VIIFTGLTKKFFPDANNGILSIVALTSAIAAIIEVDLLARALKLRSRWLDAEDLKSTAGILTMLGFGLAYALAIFLAIIGG
jgi:hypothetical protein